jgi:hypothetical protein
MRWNRAWVLVPSVAAWWGFVACGDDVVDSPATGSVEAGASDASATTDANGSEADAARSSATVTLERGSPAGDAGSSTIVVVIDAREPDQSPVPTGSIGVAASSAFVGAIQAHSGGGYQVVLTPKEASQEVPVVVTVHAVDRDVVIQKVALVLPVVSAEWGQPESVDGMVNTAGYEDGVVVSPDGEWLFVSSYSSVDVICCYLGCGAPPSPHSAACQTSLGPFGAPLRPGMFGAERILSPTHILNRCDKLCLRGADGGELESFALPPVSAFGFRRQPDGAFAEPFAIGFDAEGCGAPFGFSLLGPPTGTSAEAVFAATLGATANDLYYAKLALGAPNVLGRFTCVNGAPTLSDGVVTQLALSPLASDQGNPQFHAPYLFFDNDISKNPPTMYLTKVGGALPDASFTPSVELPVGSPASDRRQPYLHGSTLYYADELRVATAELSGDPSFAASWTAPTIALASETGSIRTGAVISLGQPTVADRPGGVSELYFVYGVRTATGINMQAGRVRRK